MSTTERDADEILALRVATFLISLVAGPIVSLPAVVFLSCLGVPAFGWWLLALATVGLAWRLAAVAGTVAGTGVLIAVGSPVSGLGVVTLAAVLFVASTCRLIRSPS